jgi:hypothetical protein
MFAKNLQRAVIFCFAQFSCDASISTSVQQAIWIWVSSRLNVIEARWSVRIRKLIKGFG